MKGPPGNLHHHGPTILQTKLCSFTMDKLYLRMHQRIQENKAICLSFLFGLGSPPSTLIICCIYIVSARKVLFDAHLCWAFISYPKAPLISHSWVTIPCIHSFFSVHCGPTIFRILPLISKHEEMAVGPKGHPTNPIPGTLNVIDNNQMDMTNPQKISLWYRIQNNKSTAWGCINPSPKPVIQPGWECTPKSGLWTATLLANCWLLLFTDVSSEPRGRFRNLYSILALPSTSKCMIGRFILVSRAQSSRLLVKLAWSVTCGQSYVKVLCSRTMY